MARAPLFIVGACVSLSVSSGLMESVVNLFVFYLWKATTDVENKMHPFDVWLWVKKLFTTNTKRVKITFGSQIFDTKWEIFK